MKYMQWLNWLMLAVVCPLITGAPSSMSQEDGSCPTENLDITNGKFVLSNNYSHGSILRYICPQGYYPSVPIRRCQDGHWDPKLTKKPAECKKITCPNPRVFENGEVIPYKEKYIVNDRTNYLCHSEFTLRGSAERVCKPNGKWNGSTPICGHDSDHCPDPGIPPGSTRTGNMFNIDDKVIYNCEKTLTLIGSKERVCQEGGHWSGTEPRCYADFTFDTPDEVSEAFSIGLKTSLEFYKQYEKTDQEGKKIRLGEGALLDIYIAVDGSESINEKYFNETKNIIKKLIDKISYYEVSPNYEILMFATDVYPIISMRNFKSSPFERNMEEIFKNLDKFKYNNKIIKTGTNIAKAYSNIYESMTIEKIKNMTNFLLTQHIVIMFTDGHANMGGSPKPKVEQIKHFVTQNNPERESKLDLYVFGVGHNVNTEVINDLASKKDNEVHVFKLPNITEVEATLDKMIDEATSVELCGIHQDYDPNNRRRAFPWLAQIKVTRSPSSNCMGSLITSGFILTAAHCFRPGDQASMISITLKKGLVVTVKRFIIHPDYNITAKVNIGILEYYEFDVALIQLEKAVDLDINLRTICIPCTKQTNGALRLTDTEGTCKKHEEILMSTNLVAASFMSGMEDGKAPAVVKNITIKQGDKRDSCIEDAKKAERIKDKTINAKEVVTDHFLCSGGISPTTDNIACKGDSGGATFVNKNNRLIQVGVVSWGSKDKCKNNMDNINSDIDSRDYHTNLFSPKIRSFLKLHIENDTIGGPLSFL